MIMIGWVIQSLSGFEGSNPSPLIFKMAIEICAVGGYNQVGKNMTAINVDGEVVLLDMGLYLEEYIKHQEKTKLQDRNVTTKDNLNYAAQEGTMR